VPGDLAALRRWESSGGAWYVSTSTDETVTISLCRCDGGEEVERLVSHDPTLLEYVAARPSSEAGEPSDAGS
jgi:hypothetical protein